MSTQSFTAYLGQNFDNTAVDGLIRQMGLDPDNFPSTKSSKLDQFVRVAMSQRRLDGLFNAVIAKSPFLTPDLVPFLYLFILERYASISGMERLCKALKIDYKQELVRGLGFFAPSGEAFVLEKQAKKVQEILEANGRLSDLLDVLSKEMPPPNLSAFTDLVGGSSGSNGGTGSDSTSAGNDEEDTAVVYENFDITIGKRGDEYSLNIVSPTSTGLASAIWQASPFNDVTIKDHIEYLADDVAQAKDVTKLGKKLSAWLLPQDIKQHLFDARNEMHDKNQRLRIRLRIETTALDLSSIPWEYCYDEQREDFFVLQPETPIVRYLHSSFKSKNLAAPRPLRVLLGIASPTDQTSLDVEREISIVTGTLDLLGDHVEVDVQRNLTTDKLRTAVAKKPHIFHFIGHGEMRHNDDERTDVGGLLFEDDNRKSKFVDAGWLKKLLSKNEIRVVVLNACKSAAQNTRGAIMGVAPRLVSDKNISAAIAMQFNVRDSVAIKFARTLYLYLASGYPLDETVTEMRLGAYDGMVDDRGYWGNPVLFMRSPDGVIWQKSKELKKQFDEILANAPEIISEKSLTELLSDIEQAVKGIETSLDPIDAEDILDKIKTAQEKAAEDPPNNKIIERRLSSTIEILEDSGLDSATSIVAQLNKAIDLASK